MAPWACPLAHAGSSSASAAQRSQDSGKGQRKGGGKGGNKGNSTHNLTLKQFGHLASQAKALQSSAATLGWTISFTPKGSGKGANKGNNNTSNRNQKSAAIRVFSSGPAGGQPTFKEGGKPAVMTINGKEVPIAWFCADCHFPHHNPRKQDCRNCGADRQPAKEPTNFIRSKVRLERAGGPENQSPSAFPFNTCSEARSKAQSTCAWLAQSPRPSSPPQQRHLHQPYRREAALALTMGQHPPWSAHHLHSSSNMQELSLKLQGKPASPLLQMAPAHQKRASRSKTKNQRLYPCMCPRACRHPSSNSSSSRASRQPPSTRSTTD